MEKLLSDFVENCARIADYRNIGQGNPVVIKIQKPTIAGEIILVCSVEEPTATYFPIGVIWIPLDGNSDNYKKCLKLVSQDSTTSTTHTWESLFYLKDLDEVVQFIDYRGPKGDEGSQGPIGEKGDSGIYESGIPSAKGQSSLDGTRAKLHTGQRVESFAYLSDIEHVANNFVYISIEAKTTHIIQHNLSSETIDVSVWGIDKRQIFPKIIEYIDGNNVAITLSDDLYIKAILVGRS